MQAPAFPLPPALAALQAATRAARARGHADVGTAIRAGRVQIVRVTYGARGRSTVVVLSEHPSLTAATAALNAL